MSTRSPATLHPTLPARRRVRPLWLACAAFVALFAAAMLAPLATALVGSFEAPVSGYTLQGWLALWNEPRLAKALANSIGLTVVTQCIAMTLGIGLAWLIGRTDLPGRRWLEFAFWISFFLPSLAVVQGWTLLLDPHYGLLNTWLMRSFGPVSYTHLTLPTIYSV